MRPCGCEFCTDLRYVTPAKLIDSDSVRFQEWIKPAREQKKFILVLGDSLEIIDKCPKCGYEFTENDYDNYIL